MSSSEERRRLGEDDQFSNALHRDGARSRKGFAALLTKDHEAQAAQADRYFKFFEDRNGKEDNTENRTSNYSTLTNAYYDLATDFYEYGWGQSFHFCRYYPGEPFYQAIARHEHYLAMHAQICETDHVLDVGCGVGGPAREICYFTGARITGISLNKYQIDRATNYTAKKGLSNRLSFIKGNFMELPFENNSFDKAYAIEATVHAPNLQGAYQEVFRVLKPGGIFALYEWVMTDNYDPGNSEHRDIAYRIEIGNGISKMMKAEDALQALKNVGFDLTYVRDLAECDDTIPWYAFLSGELKYVRNFWDLFTVFRMTRFGRFLTQSGLAVLETVGIAPQGTRKVGSTLGIAADALVEGSQKELFTPMYLFVCRKPEK